MTGSPKRHARPASKLGLIPLPRPLSLAEQRARSRWRKPVVAIVAGALASNRGLLERLKQGIYAPDPEHGEQYQVILHGLYQTTQEQIAALELFSRIDWSE